MLWTDEYATVIRAANYAERNILPHGGGWAEQPAVLVNLLEMYLNPRPYLRVCKNKEMDRG